MKRFYNLFFVSLLFLVGCNTKDTTLSDKNSDTKQQFVVENILLRRSIRVYKEEQIKPEQLDTILNCGINAPSARNMQPWAIRVIQSKQILSKLNVDCIQFMKKENSDITNNPNFNVLFHAPTLILIAGDTTNPYAQNDCGMLTQNMLLAAESMNIGSCVLGGIIQYLNSSNANDFRSKLQLPENYELFIGVVLGYKNENPEAKPRDKSKIKFIK